MIQINKENRMIQINNENYRCLIPTNKVLDIDASHFDLRNCYEVLYLNKQTGALTVGIWGHQHSIDAAIGTAQSYISIERFEVIDAWPVIELIEDEECLKRRLAYQYSRYCEDLKLIATYPKLVKRIAKAYNETLEKLGGPEANSGEFYLSIGA